MNDKSVRKLDMLDGVRLIDKFYIYLEDFFGHEEAISQLDKCLKKQIDDSISRVASEAMLGRKTTLLTVDQLVDKDLTNCSIVTGVPLNPSVVKALESRGNIVHLSEKLILSGIITVFENETAPSSICDYSYEDVLQTGDLYYCIRESAMQIKITPFGDCRVFKIV